ncbi:MAG: Smr/MutS family protein [Acidiferrobacterales bacterium]
MAKDKDSELFRDAMDGVAPINQDKVPPYREPRKPLAYQSQRDEKEVMDSLLSFEQEDIAVRSGEALSFARPGLQHTVLKKLRKGGFAIEGELDLHGQTVAEAADSLTQFINSCRQNHKRCIRIIHGKGQGSPDKIPVLKTKVNSWLRQKDEVLAFCSALQVDGGAGAVYVLLKKKKP